MSGRGRIILMSWLAASGAAWLLALRLELVSLVLLVPTLIAALWGGVVWGGVSALASLLGTSWLNGRLGGGWSAGQLGGYGLLVLLLGIVVGYVGDLRRRLQQKERALQAAMRQLAAYDVRDPLTGLYNRAGLEQQLKALEPHLHACLLLDLDDFKRLNDAFGHAVGDELLKQVAQRLRSFVGEGLCARLTGDEFMLLYPLAREAQAGRVALELLERLRQPLFCQERTFFVRASVGISLFPRDGTSVEALLKAAHSAMYRVKRRGKGSFERYSQGISEQLSARFELEYKLRDAIECNELALYYQPQVEVASGRLVGVEALLRWHHLELGVMSPARFIDIAEHSGLIVPIGAWVIESACRQFQLWRQQGSPLEHVSVNVSAVQFAHPDFYHVVEQALKRSGMAPEALELELTEGLLMQPTASVLELLKRLRQLGVRLAIDDFGVGYSSLSYLQRLPFSTLKIDKSFMPPVADTYGQRAGEQMLRSIVDLAHSLDKMVVAEGVDHEKHLSYLQQVGCELAQGYYFSKPLPPEELVKLLGIAPQLPITPEQALRNPKASHAD